MLEHILTIHYPSYQQQGFSLAPFANKALALAGTHPVIDRAIIELPFICPDISHFNRTHLLQAFRDEKVSTSSAILYTFWWGGLSHPYQAPKLYQNPVLDRLERTGGMIARELILLAQEQSIESFKARLKDIFMEQQRGEYKLSGIGTSFFTKILQFGVQARKQDNLVGPLPIIADKWSMRGAMADMKVTGFEWETIFIGPNKQGAFAFIGRVEEEFESYWKFINYFSERVESLRDTYQGIDAFRMEELVFGWPRDIDNPSNPRHIASQIIETKTHSYMTFQELRSKLNEDGIRIPNFPSLRSSTP